MEYSRNNMSRNSNSRLKDQKTMNTRLFDREMGDINYQYKYMNPINRMDIEREEFMKNSYSNEDSESESDNNFERRMPSRSGYSINKPIYDGESSSRTSNRNISSFNPYGDFAEIGSDTKLSDNINTGKTCVNGINNYGFFLFDNMLSVMNSAFIFSPYLIYSIFASLFIASEGNTEIELKNYFSFPRSDQLSSGLQEIKLKINNIGNCIIFSDEIDYNPQFCKNINMFTKIRKVNRQNYSSETEGITLALANFMGARAIVTSRDEAKRSQALQMGAVSAIDSSDAKWPVQADVVIESVGPATWDKSVRSLAPGGRMVVCGGTSGSIAEINIPRLFFKQYEIIGSSMGSYEEFDQLLAIINSGLPIAIDNVYPLHEYETALSRLERGEQLGKIVLNHGIAS